MDIRGDAAEVLETAGFNCSRGTFGQPFDVERSSSLHYVSTASASLPNLAEQEIVIADLSSRSTTQLESESPPVGITEYWQIADVGAIDPRPITMTLSREYFDRIFASGGVFILFLATPRRITYYQGAADKWGSFRERGERKQFSNYSLLSDLMRFDLSSDHGFEFTIDPRSGELGRILSRELADASFEATIDVPSSLVKRWLQIATNKYGECVAGFYGAENGNGGFLLLPRIVSLSADTLLYLIENFCMRINPGIFPFHNAQPWLHDVRYEIPKVRQLSDAIAAIRADADAKVEKLAQAIDLARQCETDWYTLLNGTGPELVGAVVRALQKLGFQNVVDLDAESASKGLEERREDIQVHDSKPILIIDVKGVRGHPEDAESTQAEKHANIRRNEQGFDQVKPLTIINYQRHLPPHERDRNGFRAEIIRNAELTRLGLMSTWDLFRLLRNKEKLNWSSEVVLPIFFRDGRIQPIPEHYSEVGTIVKVWKDAIGVVPKTPVTEGMTLAIEVGDVFDEFVIPSVQVDGKKVEYVTPGQDCGIAAANAKTRFHSGQRVFVVTSEIGLAGK